MVLAKLQKFWHDDTGATAIEYALIAAMVAVTAIATFALLGDSLIALWDNGAAEVMERQTATIRW